MSQITAEDLITTSPKSNKDLLPSPVQENMGVFSRLFRFSPLGQKMEQPKTPKEEEPPQTYYGVYIPCDSKYGPDEEILHVYTDRADALKIVKKYKKARFKALQNRQDAVAFALRGAEPMIDRSLPYAGDGLLGMEPAPGASQVINQSVGGEKPSQFKGPKPQEMVQFRKSIEAGDMELVKKTVWDNPRYLVSSGDTPSILQEGSRYNALHVAVKTMNVEMCDFLLATISDPQFIQLLFGDDNIESSKTRATILLDLYLNMPDKAMNETPLHFAVKFGAKEIVDLLVSYPQCSRQVKNKFGESPNDIICCRAKVNDSKLSSEIAFMLRERFYVPVLHSEDSSCQPTIGEPFSPASPPSFNNNNPINPRVEIRAFAGPMDKADAVTFRKKWKTPPRVGNVNPLRLAAAKFRLQDVDKGLEKVGRDLAQKLQIGWKEYWPFLDTFTDLSSVEGLGLLEDYLKNKYTAQWNDSTNSVNFPDSYSASPKTPKDETHDRIDASPKKELDNGLSPVTDLCLALQSCNLSDNGVRYKSSVRSRRFSDSRNNQFIADDEAIVNSFANPGLSPYLCIEKSCLVFAKRIGLGLGHSLTTETEMVTECLKSEAKHLQQTVASYMDDPRFHTVDFPLIHSRVAQVIAQKFKSDIMFNEDLDSIKASLRDISSRNEKISDLYSSDEEDYIPAFRNPPKESKDIKMKNSKGVNVQMKCLADGILRWLSTERANAPFKTLTTEEDCIEVWSSLHKCYCPWQTEQYFKNMKSNSYKRSQMKNKYRADGLSSSPKSAMEFVSRRLRFDNDGDSKDCMSSVLGTSPKSDKNHNLQCNGDLLSPSPNARSNVFLDTKPNSKTDTGKLNNKCKSKDEEDTLSSDDEAESDSDDDSKFLTPPSSPIPTPRSESSGESDYEDADNDFEGTDVFIQGENPTKLDKAVYDAISGCDIEFPKYPYVYRWRHTIGLYSDEERESWPSAIPEYADDTDSTITCSFNIGHISNFGTSTPSKSANRKNIYTIDKDIAADSTPGPPNWQTTGTVFNPIAMLTPRSGSSNVFNGKDNNKTTVTPPLQMSKWMRVTGPNSPRSAFVNKNFRPNVSFGF